MHDPFILSRIQFGFTIAWHIIFPSLTIGLASYLAMLEFLFLWTKKPHYMRLYRFWVKIFAISFGMGVVSGVVMSYQFGTNWSRLTDIGGAILGPLLSYEVLTAFFLEASFLGVMLFGWNKVGPRLHFFATCMVALGTLVSTFWIVAANSWMQTPAGYALVNGRLEPADWLAIIFNPSFPYRLAHMVIAAYLATGFTVGGVSAWYLWRRRATDEARTAFSMAMGFIAVMAPLQIIAGDLSGLNVREHQPAKLAAIEARWDTARSVPITLFALPNESAERNDYDLSIPKIGSLILTHHWDGEVIGLKDFKPEDRPPVIPVFFAFRVMVGLGFLMLGVALIGLWLRARKRLYESTWFQYFAMAMTPAGFIAIVAGWVTAEVGRQPYVVYGLLRTIDATSPIQGGEVSFSLTLFLISYLVVFGFGTWYILKIIALGPEAPLQDDGAAKRPARPLSAADAGPEQGA